MTRSKVKLEFIANVSTRKATFKKRKKGLLKKMDELTTLCGVDACAIIYSPYEAQPEVWPNPRVARRVMSRFLCLPEEDQGKRMLDHEAYMRQRVMKAKQLLEKLREDNRVKEMSNLMNECLSGTKTLDGLNLNDAMGLCFAIDRTMEMMRNRIAYLEKREDFRGDGAISPTPSSSDASA